MILLKKDTLYKLSVLYLMFPVIAFLITWCRWYYAIIGTAVLGFIYYRYIRIYKNDYEIRLTIKWLFIMIGIIILWCILGGQGNLYYQSSDWGARNDIFKNMIFKSAPVSFGEDYFLSYYIGHWIIPAVLTKPFLLLGLSTSTIWRIGNILLLLWTSAGITLCFFFMACISKIKNKSKLILALCIFIFFSGLDVVGILIRNSEFSTHLETWNIYYQFSSQTTQLFWVFNQAIPVWLGTVLLVSSTDIRKDAFYGVLLILFSPLPLVGCFLIVLFKVISQYLIKKRLRAFIRDLLTVENLLSVLFISPILITYMFSNTRSRGGNGMLFNLNIGGDSFYDWFMLGVFILVEFGVYLLLVYKTQKKNYLFYTILICLPFIAAYRFGTTNDFEMRASIPLLFCLMMLVIQEVMKENKIGNKQFILSYKGMILGACLLIGSITPLTEFYRGYHEVRTQHAVMLTEEEVKINKDNINFVAPAFKQTIFGRYFGK